MSSNNETTNMYPVYHDGSVLKSEDLNMSFDFLHTQLKSTRNLLFGQGIVSGLTCNYDKASGELTISSGVAVTRSGAIVEVPNDRVYDSCMLTSRHRETGDGITYPKDAEYVLIEKSIDDKEKLAENSENNSENKSNNGDSEDVVRLLDAKINLEDFSLAIQVSERILGAQNYCANLSCTYSGDKVVLEVIPILIKKQKQPDKKVEAEDQKAEQNDENADLLYMKPINVVSQGWADYDILPVFLRQATNHFYEKTVAVANSMSEITKYMQELQSKYFTFAKILEYEGHDYVSQLGTMAFNNMYIATYLSFANDMVDAANELISHYNQFLYKYRLTEVQQGYEYDNVILLGSVSENGSSSDRNSFQTHYQDTGRTQDESVLVRMYNRVLLMIKYFNPQQAGEAGDIKLMPVNSASPLGERYLPKYYGGEKNPDMKECWDAHHPYHEESVKIGEEPTDETCTFTIDDYRKADCFHLYGYEDAFTDTLKEKLQKEIRDKNLPIIVLEHELDGDESSYTLEQYNPNAGEVAREMPDDDIIGALMQSSIPYSDQSGEDVIFGKESAEERAVISKVLDDIMKLCKEQDLAKASENLKKISKSRIEEIRQAIYLMANNKPLATTDKRKLEYLLLVISYYYNVNMLKAYRMPGVDYVSGVEKKGVLLLVSQHKRAVACLNMPVLCLSISGDKYKSQLVSYITDGTGSISSILGFETLEQNTEYPRYNVEDKAKFYDVYMLHYGRNKQNTANYFRMNKGMTYTAAMNLISNAMVRIYNHVSLSEAKQITYELNEGYKACMLYVPEGRFIPSSNAQLNRIVDCQNATIVASQIDGEDKKSDLLKLFNGNPRIQNVEKDGKITVEIQMVDTTIFLKKNIAWKNIDAVLEINPIIKIINE